MIDWFSPVDADGALDATALTLRVPALAAGTYDLVADLYEGAPVTIQVEYV